jgi:hypothetical protein
MPSIKHDVQMTANDLRVILALIKKTPIEDGLFPLFVNLQEQFKEIKLKELGGNEDTIPMELS